MEANMYQNVLIVDVAPLTDDGPDVDAEGLQPPEELLVRQQGQVLALHGHAGAAAAAVRLQGEGHVQD